MADRDRPLFPVEEVFGWGVFNRLRIFPDLLVSKVRELGRLAKNQQRDKHDDVMVRAPVELLLAMLRMLEGPLRQEIDAIIGDVEEHVARRSLDFFHIPSLVVRGVVPYAQEGTYGFVNYQYRTRYPCIFLCSDIPHERLTAVDAALELPGKEGIRSLLGLKANLSRGQSSLEPPEGLAAITEAAVAEQGGAMPMRRRLLDVGDWLRGTSFFRGLSIAEAAVLGTFMQRQTVAPGETIVRQGDAGDDLYLIEAGHAEVQVSGPTGQRTIVAERGPGDCFGEIALVTGSERTADVIALTPMTLMRLSHDAYARYLSHLVDVDNQITHMALERTRATLRAVSSTQTERVLPDKT